MSSQLATCNLAVPMEIAGSYLKTNIAFSWRTPAAIIDGAFTHLKTSNRFASQRNSHDPHLNRYGACRSSAGHRGAWISSQYLHQGWECDVTDRDDLQEHILSLHRYATGLVGNPNDAEDLVQECLCRVIDRINRDAPIRNLRAYLFRTLRNVFIDQRRDANVFQTALDVEDAIDAALSARPEQEDGIRCADIMDALDHLPDAQREVVLLVSLEGMSYQEVADLTDTPIGTVRSRLHRGRTTLSALIDPDEALVKAGVAQLPERHSIFDTVKHD